MPDILPFLSSLISVSGLSGFEAPVARLIEEKWRPLVDEISTSRVGSLHGLKKGNAGLDKGSEKKTRPSLMIATHMDAIGMMVTKITDEFLRITNVGGIDVRVLPGAPVTVHTNSGEELNGVIAMPSVRLLPESTRDGVMEMKYLLVEDRK